MNAQFACAACSQGVMDADRLLADGSVLPGNDHLYGRCPCRCHTKQHTEGEGS